MRRVVWPLMSGIVSRAGGKVRQTSTHQSPDVANSDTQLKYYDPNTWPKGWTAEDIKKILYGNISTSVTDQNYETFANLLKFGDIRTLTSLLRAYCHVPEVDANLYLEKHLETDASPAMRLQERDRQIMELDNVLTVPRGTARRVVVFSNSIRGSGKTEFLKSFVLTRRLEALKCGRLIVRCCRKAQDTRNPDRAWMTRVLEDSATNSTSTTLNATDEGLCDLIRTHVESVTGSPQDASNYSNSASAYGSWIRETKTHFKMQDNHDVDPLIILDNCELLAQHHHKSFVNKPAGRPFSLLEALSLAVPAPYGIFVIGSFGTMRLLPFHSVTRALGSVFDIGPLAPLSNAGYAKALTESWNKEVDVNLHEPLFHLTEGMPRLLRLALSQEPQGVSFARGSANAFSRCFEGYKTAVKRSYGNAHEQSLAHAYSCLLASSTKATVQGDEVIHINPLWREPALKSWTYNDAIFHSIGLHNEQSKRFIVPPIALVDEMVPQPTTPILPSQLHPFLDANFIERGGARDKNMFEKAFLYAVFARYLLVFWRTMNPWVPLNEVFDGAINPEQVKLIDCFEVNLSDGVHEAPSKGQKNQKKTVTYVDGVKSLESSIWCRKVARRSAEFAVPLHFRNLRSRNIKKHPKRALVLQINGWSKAPENEVVEVDASAMSSVTWLW
ncbi:Bodo-specific multi-copy gene family, putative [Bodo saltans]|uniref:Bodo-specific multi-copy gene family, putative n=1 Tax=Bodo saltans TaxID=75058 RepID=A0A0S4JDG8_BODSA|nr:Bodo-specific multi-copy gene family, putative [Bodo saltans]|eukprot:CUG88211.1 Bodo-specific multi-copy gene family, putative [Bodo saltans]